MRRLFVPALEELRKGCDSDGEVEWVKLKGEGVSYSSFTSMPYLVPQAVAW
jgi:uncharacterized OB-fold protein